MTLSWKMDPQECPMAPHDIGILSVSRVDAAVAIHENIVSIYEEAYNAHTFDFEKDLGRFAAPDISVVLGEQLGGRWLLSETSDARADYVRNTDATVAINVETTCTADLDTTVVLVAEGDLTFTYPDMTTCTLPLLASSTLRLVDGQWVFQHIHFSRGCR